MLVATLAMLVQLASPDSSGDDRIVREARAEQARFERVRRARLPVRLGGPPSRRCTAIVGRFCYWYDSTETDAAPEPRAITEARATLIEVLDSAAAALSHEPWIAGQRTRYLVEAGRWDDAVRRLDQCGADPWWCAALAGFAFQTGQQYASADSAFGVALAAMPAEQRCEWMDIRWLTEGAWARELDAVTCDERMVLAERIWRVSQPLWMFPGNDFRSEHLARSTMAALLEGSANAHGMRFAKDSRELLMRYGWATWFSRQLPDGITAGGYSVTGHDREPSYHFFPALPSLAGAFQIDSASWRFRDSLARTRYAPRHIDRLTPLAHRVAVFPRGDSMLVSVAFAIRDSAIARDSVATAFATLRGERLDIRRGAAGTRDFQVTVPADTLVVGVEVYGLASHHAARMRRTVIPPPCAPGACLSTLLLLRAEEADTAIPVERALALAEVRSEWRVGEPLAAFWELTSVPGSAATFSLVVAPARISMARRVGAALRLARRPEPVRLSWRGVARRDRETHLVTLRMPPWARGPYRIILTVERADGSTLTAERQVVLR